VNSRMKAPRSLFRPDPGDAPDRAVTRALATLSLLLALPYATPRCARLRVLEPLEPGAGLSFAPAPRSDAEAIGVVPIPASPPEGERPPGVARSDSEPRETTPDGIATAARAAQPEEEPSPTPIEDPTHRALDPYFEELRRLERGEPGVRVRIAVWGDSTVETDLVTAGLRRSLQRRFGDGGHGFVMPIAPTWRYLHEGVRLGTGAGWAMSRINGPLASDGLYGLGATTLHALGPLAHATVGTATTGDFGRRVSRFEVDYLEHPGGEPFELLVDGTPARLVETRGERARSAAVTLEVEDGPHELRLAPRGSGVRLFGVVLERERGIVVDALGVTNSWMGQLARIAPDHLAEQLAWRAPALLVFNFGINEARAVSQEFPGFDAYERQLREVLGSFRQRAPRAGCLVHGPLDAGFRDGTAIRGFPRMTPVIEAQRRGAAEVGCAFWDGRAAMGGEGAMARWRAQGLADHELLHPTREGATKLGAWLHSALLEEYRAFLARTGSR